MKRYVPIFICIAVLAVAAAFSLIKCSPDETESNLSQTVSKSEDNIEPSHTESDSSYDSVSGEQSREEISIYENSVPADIDISTTDTSGMEFSFAEEDMSAAEPTPDTQVSIDDISQGNESKNVYNITKGGTYTFSGKITDIMITVDAGDDEVTIILNGANISNSNGPAVFVRSADKVTLTLADGTVNNISDGKSYTITDSGSNLDGAIFSKADLTINGSGTLNVNGNCKHGIVSKDNLIIVSGTVNVNSANVGINGKDCVKIYDGDITVNAGSDGIRSDNTEDADRGYVYIYGGSIDITAGNDGIQAETVINIENAYLDIVSGGGSSGSLTNSDESYKGLKAGKDIYITGGVFNIDSKDDCIHSNGTITIAGGKYTLASGDDGIHADTDLAIYGSSTVLTVNKSYEGIEATNIIISDGSISVTATDDGINAAGGNDNSSSSGRPGAGSFSSSNGSITISGGKIYISASGDGLDANGTLDITGGEITVSGANRGDTAILDFDKTGKISGGVFIGTGASSMAQNFSSSSTQGVILIKTGTQKAGTVITVKDSSGNVLITKTADGDYSCIILSCEGIVKGGTYTVTAGSYSTTVKMTSTVYGSSGNNSGRK